MLSFFSGLIPRLLGDVLSLWICNLLAHLINTYAIDDSVCHFFYTAQSSQGLFMVVPEWYKDLIAPKSTLQATFTARLCGE